MSEHNPNAYVIFMTHSPDSTRPTSPVDQLQYAINLVKAGRTVESCEVLRRIVALQPVNQTAWLWLSAIAAERAEAEAALAQVRRINPLHPRLKQAEQWLDQRFTVQPDQAATLPLASSGKQNQAVTMPISTPTQPNQTVTLPMPSLQVPIPEIPRSGYLPNIPHLVTLAGVAVAAFVGLGGWFLGVTLPVSATIGGPSALVSTADDLLTDRPAALDEAWAKRDWPGAIAILEGLYQSRPNSETVKDQLTHAYLQQGIAQRHKGFVVEAQPYFERALFLNPHQLRVQQEQRLASDYLAGVEHYQAGRWEKAIEALAGVQIEDADYVHVKDLLYSAYYNQGLALQAADELSAARKSLEAAISLRPDLPEPRRQIAEIEFALAPQTAPEPPISSASTQDKLIVVGIAEQRMWIFEKDKKVFDFIVSTGEPGSDTAIGNFEILDKIDVAYASTWNLDMPYWMGIYWAGSTMENGIHSLPIVKHTGYKLWDGYLGQRVSYGCVILSDENAATLYEWASVGVKVKIVPSLAAWSLE